MNTKEIWYFVKRGISVLPGARCCNEHLYKKQLSYEALNQISASECDCILVNSNQLNQILVSFRLAIQNQKIFDFDDPTCMGDTTAYYNTTGLEKSTIRRVFSIVKIAYHAT